MNAKAADISVQAWQSDGILLEQYCYTAGIVEPLPKHCHEEYQFGLSFDCAGQYHYRGASHDIPIASLSIIHSGEVHAPSDRTFLPEPITFWMMTIHPKWFQSASADLAASEISPFFPDIYLADPQLNQLFITLQQKTDLQSQLERDINLWDFLSYLLTNYAENRLVGSPLSSTRTAIKQVCDYLHAHFATDVTLDQLSELAGLSRFHLSRVFRQEIGLSLTAYQTQLRISHAKKLLAEGMAIATVASLTGFYDQSHFGWQFKRRVGVTPGNYRETTVCRKTTSHAIS
ncbi:helix-turn-helix transcriptional regulator [Leptolyngbya sp. FACHB-541]|uniref:AraC family transcriptional regulator n=1 Tax=Leptolyngbya sp. FACHB-541 TaxID=2692810 RepID=UPI001686818C|nr:AraC family transcriptional regulator [Leptolyngbya sp. FACHB-541]MBD1998938.1 helix-turn-helix transcriptional regulator [Leptolyngbya sp. FACHB-541]